MRRWLAPFMQGISEYEYLVTSDTHVGMMGEFFIGQIISFLF